MRLRQLGVIVVSTASVTASLVFAGQAHAVAAVETLNAGTNINLCVSDNDHHPSSTGSPKLVLVGCNVNNGNDTFYATASSYGSGWFSIVSNDHYASSGAFCITGVASNGVQMYLEGCNGGNLQAFKRVCVSGGTELENAAGVAINDYGGAGHADDSVASWHFENPAPNSLIFTESAHDMGSC
jgi:hypothetical protein